MLLSEDIFEWTAYQRRLGPKEAETKARASVFFVAAIEFVSPDVKHTD
jgi:hypothetical protein